VTAILAIIFEIALATSSPASVTRARPTLADGSVWADVLDADGTVRATERLADVDARTTWLAADVDGDGRQDLVAVRVGVLGMSVDVWHNGLDGFARRAAAPRHLVRPLARLLRDAILGLFTFSLPSA
jgi:hypothetical protein